MRHILREREVAELTQRSRVTRWRDERAGRFPLRVRIGPNAVGWFAGDIQAWLEARPRGIRPSSRAA